MNTSLTTTDTLRLENLIVARFGQLLDDLPPIALVTVKRLARDIFRELPTADLPGDFWLAGLHAQGLIIGDILRRLRDRFVRDQDLIQAIEKATQLEIEGSLISRLTLARLLEPLAREDPRYVDVLVMKHAFGCTYDEIRAATDLSVQQIRTLLARALTIVRPDTAGNRG